MKQTKTFAVLMMLCSMQAFSQNCGTVDAWEYTATATSATHSDYTVNIDGLSTSNGTKSIHNFKIVCNTDTIYSTTTCFNTGPSNSGPISSSFSFNAPTCTGYELVLVYSGRTTSACGGNTCLLNVTASNPISVPVSWLDFKASCGEDDVILQWSTASEVNNSGFQVQQFVDGENWETVGFVPAKGSGNEIQNYIFSMDKSLNRSGIYRLKQMDYDGTSDYSKITNLDCETTDVVMYPNPAQDVIQFSNEINNVIVSDIQGVEMFISDEFISTIDVADFQEGIYVLKYEVNGSVFTKRLSVDRSN